MFASAPQHFADVVLPLSLKGCFTYSVPDELLAEAQVGKRAVVQFGAKRFYSAIIVNLHDTPPVGFAVKDLVSVLDAKPLLTETHLSFWRWIADYYMCSLGEVFKAAMPSGLKIESETKLFANPDFCGQIDDADEQLIMDFLVRKRSLKVQDVATLTGRKNVLPIIKRMAEREIILLNESLVRKYRPKTEWHISLAVPSGDAEFAERVGAGLSKAPKQRELFSFLVQYFNEHPAESSLERAKLLALSASTAQALSALAEKGAIAIEEREIGRLSLGAPESSERKQLNEHQQRALDEINQLFTQKDTVLLHGVTASGKTEIYIQLIDQILRSGRQVLYLLPEIALTTQIISRIKRIFGSKIGIYHSRFSDGERVEVWHNIVNSENPASFQIVIGVRSAIFLPFTDLGLIIVDEEHETSFKQYDPAPRYNARDAAMVLARMHGAKLLLGTATPSVETYFHALSGKYGLVELFRRHKDIALPRINIVDIREAKKKKQMHSHFSQHLLVKIEDRLQKGEQVILFQNRRGFSPYIVCDECGTIPRCKYCDVSLTYHKYTNTLVCHYCGYTESNTGSCTACGSRESATQGFGTEKIEDELKILLPHARLQRMDLDTTRAKDAYETIIGEFEMGKVDILIGTQMVTKGLDFANVSLVGILDADTLLNQPDFRAFERSFQMLTQVSGRAGRSGEQGEVLIQTSSPQHPVLTDVIENNYLRLYQQQMDERQMFLYPPFTRLIRIYIKHRDIDRLKSASGLLANYLRKVFGGRVLGPEAPLVGKVQNLFIESILLKIERERPLSKAKELIERAIETLLEKDVAKGIEYVIDIDPY